jgi:hypothetical protein
MASAEGRMSAETLDLTLLDSGNANHAVGLARWGHDVATARIPRDDLAPLGSFRQRIEAAMYGRGARPETKELARFGEKLFELSVRDDLRRLYDRLPETDVRILVLSNSGDFQSLPWEFLTEPGRPCKPSRDRCVVRVVPTIGLRLPSPRPLGAVTRVLFASADPADQGQVSWPDVKAAIELAFAGQLPRDRFALEAIQGTTKAALARAVAGGPCDIFHFSGHGEVVKGIGCLLLVDPATGRTSRLPADELAAILQGKDIRLVVLSACDTAAGNFVDDFAVVATALVRSGIPAVVANQFPVFDDTIAAFVGAMYAELLRSGDIDRAVSEGRIQLFVTLDGVGTKLEWGVPTLYRRLGTAQLFQP